MPRPKKNIDEETVRKAEEELKKIEDGKLSIQLKAIIAAGRNPVNKVADILQVSSRSIFRWIAKFKERGIEKLKDNPKGHMRSKLTEEHKKQIEQWVINGRNSKGKNIHWTIKKLKKEIDDELDVKIGLTPLWKHLKKMDLVIKKPRPVHAKADPKLQETFKKKFLPKPSHL